MTLTHHAYYLEGSLSLLPSLEVRARELGGFAGGGNADVVVQSYEKFGIDEARALKDLAALRSVSGRALFIIAAASMTSEAQQALLKLLEEPQAGSVFVLLVPHGTLLSTVRSRCLPFPALRSDGARAASEAPPFLKMGYKERTDFLAKMLKDDEGVRERVREFLNALERELYGRLGSAGEKAAELAETLSDISRFRSYLADRSPSLKMMLEHLAASAPQLR